MKSPTCFLLTILLFISIASSGQIIQASQKSTSINCKDFFKADEPVELTLVSDFKTLKSKKKKGAYQPATAILYLLDRDSISEPVSIYARGEFRRELCQMPSLMVNFKSKTESQLSGLKKMKMVCGCSSTTSNETLVLKEFLAYKIYNLLTDLSFKARLVKVNYKDINGRTKPYSQYAFLIEDVDEMAKRNACREFEYKASSHLSDRKQMTLVNLFQYMIGNLDWSVPNFHNIKLIQPKADTIAYPYVVPYDFDFSGLVNAHYAFPNHETFNIDKVTDRLYRGFPRTMEELEETLQLFHNNKEKIMSLIMGFELLQLRERKDMADYLEEFFTIISDKRRIKQEFINGARTN